MEPKRSDEELLGLYVRTGDSRYFGELYERYIPLLYGVCLKYMRSPEAAEDAVMGMFGMLLERIADYDIKVFRTWVHSVARNHCLQLLRRKKVVEVEFDGNYFMESDPVLHLLDEAAEGRSEQALGECIDRLPATQRTSVVMFFLEGLSYAQVSERSGYSVQAVKSYIQNGKRNLKLCLQAKGVK